MSPRDATPIPSPADWLTGGGELGDLIRARDWSRTSLGPLDTWPQSVRSVVGMMLASRAQIILFWGPDHVVLYNDAYVPVFALKHPWALGKTGREAWSEIWGDVLHPLLDGVVRTGEAFSAADHPFVLERLGYPEETYFDISYDPVRDESAGVGGVFCIVSETTGRVIGERRLRMLSDLGKALTGAQTVEAVFTRGAEVLARSGKDVAFAVGYSRRGDAYHRTCTVNVPARADWAPETLDASGPWPLATLGQGGCVVEGKALESFGALPGGDWPESAQRVIVLPLEPPGSSEPGLLILGASPRRPLDDNYRDFLRLVGASFASALGAAQALEAERHRSEMLAELDRAKTAFFSNVSHEFRTPLTLLLAPLEEALAGGTLPAPVRPPLEAAHRNALRLLKLVNTLLDFSRMEAGRMQARYEPVDLARATRELAGNFASACEKAGLAFDVRCDPLPERVWVDRDMWEKVVLNLLSNAFKFTLAGSIEVRLRHEARGPVLSVRDTGAGIPAEELPRLFERFHRIEGVRARTHEGSGIGLALVNELVRMHGGRIEVESEAGRGTRFDLHLVYGNGHLPQDRLAERESESTNLRAKAFVEEALAWLRGVEAEPGAANGEAPGAAGRADARVLVVEDNADMRDHLARVLRERWQVSVATDGEDALAKLRAERFDLVVADVMMPRLDGFGLLRALRADSALAETPVVMLSARAGEEARIEGLDAGADDYLVKPFGARELVAVVRSQLSIRRLRLAASAERELLLAAERAARQDAQLQRERMVRLFMQTPHPIVILTGPEHRIELANPATCEVWGRTAAQVEGKPLLEALPELRGQPFCDLLDEVMRTGKPYLGREHAADLQRDGRTEQVYFNFVYEPMRDTDGEVEGVLVSAFDVTQEVMARRDMDQLRARAEDANRAKDEFLAMLGHELRNPLSPIVGALKLLRLRGVEAPELDILERQSHHLTRLVNDLLDVSRIARGRLDLKMRPIDIRDVVKQAMDMASPLVEERGHTVDLHMPLGTLCVMGDLDRLAQVVANLLTNAAKYSDPGSRIAVHCTREADRVVLAVEDEGVGISPDMLHRVFDLFVQQPQTLDRAHGGLGLGLAIVKNLVELHGGRASVRSDGPGRGSRFTIDLPAAQAAAVEHAPAGAAGRVRTAGPLRVMIVDDNADSLRTLGHALTLIGHSVQVASDGEAALSTAQRFQPQVALVDIGLPHMNGYELARRLRALPNPPARLFAVTGYGLDADREAAAAAGFDRHFIKPVDAIELDAALAATGPAARALSA